MLDALILFVTGIVVGAVNNLAGAAGALGLIALEEVAGMGPLQANATLRPSAVAVGVMGWLGFRSRGRSVPPRMWRYAMVAAPGAALGAWGAVNLPVWVFRGYLAAILLYVLAQQFRNRASSLTAVATHDAIPWQRAAAFVFIGLHMGFVQVGTGLICIAALTAVHSRDLVQVNTAKMTLVIVSSITAVLCLALSDDLVWLPALQLTAGAALGSFFASRWSVSKGHGSLRIVVVAITLIVLARLAWQTFGIAS